MFKLEDYYPINEEEVREAWGHQINGLAQEYYDYYEVEKNIEYVNNTALPDAYREFRLNMLPAMVIAILNTRKYKENAKIFT